MNYSAHARNAYKNFGSIAGIPKIPYHQIGIIVALGDAALIIFASFLGDVGYRYFWTGTLQGAEISLGIGFLACVFYRLLGRLWGLYELPSLLAYQQRSSAVMLTWTITLLALILVLFLLKVSSVFSRGSIIVFGVLGLVLLVMFRLLVNSYFRAAVATRSILGRRAVIIGEPDELAALNAAKLLGRFGIEEVARVAVSSDRGEGLPALARSEFAKVDRAVQLARDSDAREIVVALRWSNTTLLGLVRERLRCSPLPVRLLPDRSIRRLINGSQGVAGAGFSVELQREPLSKMEQVVKRSVDILMASAILLALSPLLVIVAIAIKLDSRGPVIFRQRRNGFNGRQFVIYKFRTMNVLEDGAVVVQAKRWDSRITAFGSLLRRSSIDELPQLFNVLKGDMSLIGPRPHALAHDDEYGLQIANYAFRHHVKPGITGWAQVNGFRGETTRIELMKERVEADLWYINNWSFWLDLRIMLRTLGEVARGGNAY